MGWDCLAYKYYWLRDHFLLVARSDHTTGSRNVKPKVVFRVQKMARYALFCLIMGLFKGEVPVFARSRENFVALGSTLALFGTLRSCAP